MFTIMSRQVVVVVFLMTFLFKRDTDLRRFQALYGNMMFAELTPGVYWNG